MSAFVSHHNQRVWAGRISAFEVSRDKQLFAAEATILREIGTEFAGGAILDIGVGAGRSTRQLLEISKDYVGIDYSEAMVHAAKAARPGVDFRYDDARDLSAFEDGQFDLVWFSFNGIDYVSHEDRLKILSEVRRVLKPTGAFCFSAHNRDHPVREAHDLSHIVFSLNPITLLKGVVTYPLGLIHSSYMKKHEVISDDFAILNDEAFYYRHLTYYISEEKQTIQLGNAGFCNVRSYGMNGKTTAAGARHADSFMIYYLARSLEACDLKKTCQAQGDHIVIADAGGEVVVGDINKKAPL